MLACCELFPPASNLNSRTVAQNEVHFDQAATPASQTKMPSALVEESKDAPKGSGWSSLPSKTPYPTLIIP